MTETSKMVIKDHELLGSADFFKKVQKNLRAMYEEQTEKIPMSAKVYGTDTPHTYVIEFTTETEPDESPTQKEEIKDPRTAQ